jgi:hypothetical protein
LHVHSKLLVHFTYDKRNAGSVTNTSDVLLLTYLIVLGIEVEVMLLIKPGD